MKAIISEAGTLQCNPELIPADQIPYNESLDTVS